MGRWVAACVNEWAGQAFAKPPPSLQDVLLGDAPAAPQMVEFDEEALTRSKGGRAKVEEAVRAILDYHQASGHRFQSAEGCFV